MRRTIIPILFVFLFLFGCTTFGGHDVSKPLEPDKAYIAICPPGSDVDFAIQFQNLDTQKKIWLNCTADDYTIYEMAPGRYSVLLFTGTSLAGNIRINYQLSVPVSMMRMLHIEPGTALFLGKIAMEDFKKEQFSQVYEYDIDEAYYSLNETYINMQDIELVGF